MRLVDALLPIDFQRLTQGVGSPQEILESATEAGDAIQAVQNLTGSRIVDEAKVRFPRGFLMEISVWRRALSFIKAPLLRSATADALMAYQVQSWLLERTDLAGHAYDMLLKATLGTLGSVGEALLIDATTPPMGRRQAISSRLKALRATASVFDELHDDLTWLWSVRNRQHLHSLSSREFAEYSRKDYLRAESCVARLIIALRNRGPLVAA